MRVLKHVKLIDHIELSFSEIRKLISRLPFALFATVW